MREITLYEMQPQYMMCDVTNIVALKEKIEEDEKVFIQIEKDFKKNPIKYKQEFLKAKKNHLNNKYFYCWFCLKRYFEQAILAESFKNYNTQKNELKKMGWMLPQQLINSSFSTLDPNVTTEELYIRNIDRFFDDFFSFVIEKPNSRIDRYYLQAITNYKNHCYYACVVSLFPIIESYHKIITNFNEDSFYRIKENLNKVSNKIKDVRKMYKKDIDYYVDLVKQFNDLVTNHYFSNSMEKEKEPAIINRNRIMHGLFTREINQKDCLQLFCVISNMRTIKNIIDINDNMNEILKELKQLE